MRSLDSTDVGEIATGLSHLIAGLTLCASKSDGQHFERAAGAEPVGLSEEDQESQTTVVELR